jgi:beta-N-acetylhexosaminidase
VSPGRGRPASRVAALLCGLVLAAGAAIALAIVLGGQSGARPLSGSSGGAAASGGGGSSPAPTGTQPTGGTSPSGGSGSSGSGATIPLPSSKTKLLGQRIMVAFSGTTPSSGLLGRIRAGAVGSVILFGENIASAGQVARLTARLQAAARQGGNPPLLIATDQEGGEVKRLPAGPPSLSPPQMVAAGGPNLARRQGVATGRYLKRLGINLDLAPVLDVPTFHGAFIWGQGRAFAFSAGTVAKYGSQFALGLQHAGVAAAGKHFPGLGSAAVTTDTQFDVLRPTPAQRRAALVPYRTLIPQGLDVVLVSVAAYPAYDPTDTPAALSPRLIGGLLRGKLGFGGVVITDSISNRTSTGQSENRAGALAATAGADILLFTDPAPRALAALAAAMGSGQIRLAAADASYRRIVALKQLVAG